MKDELKRESITNYTAWDLNAKCVQFRPKNKKKLKRIFKKIARQKIKKVLTIPEESGNI